MDVNLPFCFGFVLLCTGGHFSKYKPPGGGAYIWREDLNGGFLRYRFEGLIFGGAYTWRGLFLAFYGILSDDYDDVIYTLLLIPGGGYYWEYLVGM